MSKYPQVGELITSNMRPEKYWFVITKKTLNIKPSKHEVIHLGFINIQLQKFVTNLKFKINEPNKNSQQK